MIKFPASPPTPEPVQEVPVDNSLQSTTIPSFEIVEKREMLSPISPHPVHVAEPSDIPVLKNQMDPTFNNTETHAHPSDISSNGFVELDYDPENATTTSFMEPQPTPLASTSEVTNNSSPSSSSPSSFAAESAPQNGGSSSARNGNVPDTNGSNGVNKDPADVNAPSNGSSNSHFYLQNNLPTNVDLQALLTKLSPGVPQQPVPSQGAPAPSTSTAPAQTSPSQARATSLPQPPAPAQPVSQSQPAAQTHQPTHPLPAPPATFAVNSTSGHASHSAGYPASLPPPPNFNQHRPASPTGSDEFEEEIRPFTAEEEDAYERFLSDERDYVTQGQWDRFPAGSRLFIGNLPTERVTKRDLFRIFHKHGRLAQVSIKQAYGFVQFLDTTSCASALRHEQGSSVRGRKMHLEVSKPQRNTRPPPSDTSGQRVNRRSRSPDYGRALSPRGRGGSSFRGTRGDFNERGLTRGGRDVRDRDYEYSRRSPPPRHRARDDWRPHHRSRSRSPPPPSRYRPRSRSPILESESLPPRRDPKDVPDVQAIVTDELDRGFIWWVEKAFRDRGLSYESLFLHPRMPVAAVVRQQILEGVQAVVFLDIQKQREGAISIQVFDRRGSGEARYDQYDNIEPPIAAEIVIRAKQAHAPQPATLPSYGYGLAQHQQPQQQLLQQGAPINLANVLQSLDPSTLGKLLSGLQQQQQQQPQQQTMHQQHAPQLNADLAALLGQAARPHSATQTAAPTGSYGGTQLGLNTGYTSSPGLAALLGGNQQSPVQTQQQPQNPGQMQNIMETLAKWKQG